jgi:hypothetical protein
MSLIPSESSSFADLLGRGLDGSKKSKWREPVTEPPKLPDPPKSSTRSSALKQKPQPEQLAGPKAPANRKAAAKKPPVVSLKEESVPLPAPVLIEPLEPLSPVIEPELKEDTLLPLIPQPINVPLQAAPAPEPFAPLQPAQPLEPVQQQSIVKAPLVIQPKDEPPRRPIPIVRVARSKQDPHGNGRGTIAETNGHDLSVPAPIAVPFSSGAPRLRPKPLMRPQTPQPLIHVPRESVEDPQSFGPISPSEMAVEPDPAESDPWQPEESAWTSEHLPRRRLQIQWGSRLVRCLTYEAAAILVLIVAVLVGLGHRSSDDPLNLMTRILAIGAAIVAAGIPVLFYGLPERFPRDPR